MVSVSTALSALTVAAIAASTGVDAHGTLAKPGLKFTGTAYGGDFSALVPMTALKPQAGDIFTNYPDANKNAAAFGRAFKASQYKTLKDFILKNQDLSKGRSKMPKTAACGFTDPTGGAVQPLPAQIEWYGGVMNHPGPCEVWCDNTVVVPFDTNCAQKYPNGKFNYDKSKCTGKSRMTMYWMSTLLEWQVYIDCAKIGGGGRSLDFDDINDQPAGEYNATAYEAEAERSTAEEDAEMDEIAHMTELAERNQYEAVDEAEILPESGPDGEVDTTEILPESNPDDEVDTTEILPESGPEETD